MNQPTTFAQNTTCAAQGCQGHVSGLHGIIVGSTFYGVCARCAIEARREMLRPYVAHSNTLGTVTIPPKDWN